MSEGKEKKIQQQEKKRGLTKQEVRKNKREMGKSKMAPSALLLFVFKYENFHNSIKYIIEQQ